MLNLSFLILTNKIKKSSKCNCLKCQFAFTPRYNYTRIIYSEMKLITKFTSICEQR